MDRLIAGRPLRSDGKLTIKSLAAEADVKRWVLTHKHTDLQDEFRQRIATHGETPEAFRHLADENRRLNQKVDRLTAELVTADKELKLYARVVQVLTLEKEQFRSEVANAASNIHPLRPRPKNDVERP